MSEGRRAPVNGSPYGTISWEEHVEAWIPYARRYGNDQDAERIAARGGFGLTELISQLGRMPVSWEPSSATEQWWKRFREESK